MFRRSDISAWQFIQWPKQFELPNNRKTGLCSCGFVVSIRLGTGVWPNEEERTKRGALSYRRKNILNAGSEAPAARIVKAWANRPGSVAQYQNERQGAECVVHIAEASERANYFALSALHDHHCLVTWAVGPGFYIARLWRCH